MRKYAAALLLILPVLAGCGGASGTTTYGDQVTVIKVSDRKAPIELRGTGLDGRPIDLASYRGKPVVVNLWGSWCAPCRVEAPTLLKASTALGTAAQFVGIDIRDSRDNATAYERNFGITWPSIDASDGKALLAFSGVFSVRSPPVTVVLDSQGRVAGYVMGIMPSAQTLVTLVQEVDGG